MVTWGSLGGYLGGETQGRGVQEMGGDQWIETTDREVSRLRVNFLVSTKKIPAGTSFVARGNFGHHTRRVAMRATEVVDHSRSRSLTGFSFASGLWVAQKHTSTQTHYLVDTFFTGGLTPARVGGVRSLGLGASLTGTDFEARQVPNVPMWSLASQYRSTPWLEREMAEMHGGTFLYHPDARFLLLDYGIQHGYDQQNRLS